VCGPQYSSNHTYSVKYNLVWQKILGVNVFPQSVFDLENKYYMSKYLQFGAPMDNRASFTMTPYTFWSAAFTTPEDYGQLIKGMYNMYDQTPDRVPFTDW
jgi:hypothetical protein